MVTAIIDKIVTFTIYAANPIYPEMQKVWSMQQSSKKKKKTQIQILGGMLRGESLRQPVPRIIAYKRDLAADEPAAYCQAR